MNVIFCAAMAIALCSLLFTAPSAVLPALTAGAEQAVRLCVTLVAVFAVWMSFTEIAMQTGLHKKLARLFSPLLRFLFGDLDEETEECLSLNLSANLLGLGSVATPMGIAAVEKMQNALLSSPLSERKRAETLFEKRTTALFVLNCCMIQLLPTSVISLRLSLGSGAPGDVILPSLLTGAFSLVFGVLLLKTYERIPRKIWVFSRKKTGARTVRGINFKKNAEGSSPSENRAAFSAKEEA